MAVSPCGRTTKICKKKRQDDPFICAKAARTEANAIKANARNLQVNPKSTNTSTRCSKADTITTNINSRTLKTDTKSKAVQFPNMSRKDAKMVDTKV